MNYSEGWHLCELDQELRERGIDIGDLNAEEVDRALSRETPRKAAEEIERRLCED